MRVLAADGVRHEVIRRCIFNRAGRPIAARTLVKAFQHELEQGRAYANVAVALTLYRQAVSGDNTSATIFWMKSQAGWRTTDRAVVTRTVEVRCDGCPMASMRVADPPLSASY